MLFSLKFKPTIRVCQRLSSSITKFSPYQLSFPTVTSEQWSKLSLLSENLARWNEKVNLVSRKDIDELIPNHIIPSLSINLVKTFLPNEKVIDIGTGGGLPGLPLAIVNEETLFTLLDSCGKKMNVVEDLVQTLNLKNVRVVTSRSEDFREKFDVLLGRGVSNLPNFLSLTSHLLNPKAKQLYNGLFYIKGGDFTEELNQAKVVDYTTTPVHQLVNGLLSDKFILHIPAEQIHSVNLNKKFYKK